MDKTGKTTRFSVRPLYLQVYDTLVARVTSGTWPPGATLPNEIDLAHELGVSIGTVRKALEEMENKHIVVRRQGRGTFVSDQSSGELALRFNHVRDGRGNPIEGRIESQEVETGPGTDGELAELELAPRAEVIRIKRSRSNGGRMFMVERLSLPASMFPKLAPDAPMKLSEIAQQNGVILTRSVEQVSLMAAPDEIAEALRIRRETPLLRMARRIFAVDGRPAEWRLAYCHMIDERYECVIS